MTELIERLRKERSVYDAELCDAAADRLEALESAVEKIVRFEPIDDSAYFDVRDIAQSVSSGHNEN